MGNLAGTSVAAQCRMAPFFFNSGFLNAWFHASRSRFLKAIKVERPRGGCQPICEVLYGIGIAACVECVVSRSRGERP